MSDNKVNKPVAWMLVDENWNDFCRYSSYPTKGAIPLYTHPAEHEELKATVRSFFEDFLNVREESDSGRVFAPITLSSTRCMMTDPLCDILQKMRKLSGAADAPKRESWDERSDNERCNGK